ncbi:DUF2279 domain-containing protein [Aurantibacillus circumpalustris]|uniref:DUF2279 domain-containing protein n=1 Tax=Aurantibacillus circumpalustris TaxID=3036359 RepID=UPI00295A6548|nr:DUF2279 domain-containing protein [Aurantibacillus circumpalustris]
MHRAVSFIIFFVFLCHVIYGQNDSLVPPHSKRRKIILASTTGAVTVASLLVLNQTWYSEYNTGKFHLFNDNKEWLQMDKVGHVYTTYQTSRLMMEAFNWAGYSRKQKLFIGGGIGFVYMTAIEIMDGYSRGWGYSWGDQLADVVGSGIAILQNAYWNEQRVQLKFSYSQSGLTQYNPSLLGKNKYSQILKDYNGQTYWLSVNPSSFLKKENKFPKWLNIAFGYSAYGMLGGYSNEVLAVDNKGNVLKIDRERRLYFSLDVDLTKIKTKSKVLKGLFSLVNILKFPAPAIQFSSKGVRFYGLYY